MVASSVVLTVVVLNYHHRTADIHEMPPWVICLSSSSPPPPLIDLPSSPPSCAIYLHTWKSFPRPPPSVPSSSVLVSSIIISLIMFIPVPRNRGFCRSLLSCSSTSSGVALITTPPSLSCALRKILSTRAAAEEGWWNVKWENEQDLISCQLEPETFLLVLLLLLFVVLLRVQISTAINLCTDLHTVPDQGRVPAVVAVDSADESTGQEDHPQDHHAEQSNEGARAEGALLEITACQRARHRRRLPASCRPINRIPNGHRTVSVSIAVRVVGCGGVVEWRGLTGVLLISLW